MSETNGPGGALLTIMFIAMSVVFMVICFWAHVAFWFLSLQFPILAGLELPLSIVVGVMSMLSITMPKADG